MHSTSSLSQPGKRLPPTLGRTVDEVLAGWKRQRAAHGPSGPESTIAIALGLGTFAWSPTGELERWERGLGRAVPAVERASRREFAELVHALEQGQVEIRTTGTSGPYADRSRNGVVLHQATGRALPHLMPPHDGQEPEQAPGGDRGRCQDGAARRCQGGGSRS